MPLLASLHKPVLRAAALAAGLFGLAACATGPETLEPQINPDLVFKPVEVPRHTPRPRPAPPQPDLVVIGAVAFAPAPDSFDTESPVIPTLADHLAEGFRTSAVQATGDSFGMAILCRLPAIDVQLKSQGAADLRQPDFVLMTRPPTTDERALCERQGVRLETVKIGRYLGGLPNDGDIEGAWVAFSAARIADFPEKRALIDRARLLIGANGYSQHFSAL